ncbi:putative exported heme receptor protein [Glycocaulis alkaliphilus]|uniref:Putative exported heme receptor protein n=2 Tax=Glycocaulis alkaliphilus TaxID=1434191 RepID=A0A3T0E879_9PROT|nr:putative exported heme receptor protein [Glycocaulis alkaliphilus]
MEERIFDVPVSVSAIDRNQIERTETSTLRQLYRYMPGVDVVRDRRGRAGDANIQIRGIGGRRVLMLVDGVRLPDGFGAAGISDQARGKLDVEAIQRTEVVRGPSSALYGSDALGGIVAFRTKRPGDILDEGQTFGGAAGAGYDSAHESWFVTGDLAGRTGPAAGLIGLTYRQASELSNNHPDFRPDPQSIEAFNLLARGEFDAGRGHLFAATAEWFVSEVETDRLSANVAVGPPPIRVFDANTGDDRSERWRLGGSWHWTPEGGGWVSRAQAQIDYQESRTEEYSTFTVTTVGMGPPQTLAREDRLDFTQEQWSSTGDVLIEPPHVPWLSLVAGYEWVRKETGQFDDKLQRNTVTGVESQVVEGDTYPRKLYPDTTTSMYGLFGQARMELFDGRLVVTPSVRFDRYELDISPDALFDNANVLGFQPVGLRETAITPRLGAIWRATGQISLFANYAEGFRAPGPEQLNRIGRVPVATFVHDFLPNPDLGPERSRGWEFGARGAWRALSAELALYENRYSDFIDTALIEFIPAGTIGNPLAIRRFQSVNVDSVRIRGVEASAALDVGAVLTGADGLVLRAAGSWSEGRNRTADRPLNSVPAPQAVVGLSYDAPSARWGAEGHATFVAEKDDVAPIESQGQVVPHVTQDGYATLDLSAWIGIGTNARVNLMVSNVFDQRYWEWPDLVNLPATDASLGRYTAPGRTVAVSLRTRF